MLIRDFNLSEINLLPQEEACATKLVKETMNRARTDTVIDALGYGTRALGFDSFVFGIVANDRRPDAESRGYILTNQAEEWVRIYDERAFLEFDPRVDMAMEPGFTYWEAREYDNNLLHTVFLTEAAAYDIRSGLVLGLCTRDPPSYAVMALNRAAPTLDRWSAEHRLLIAAQALLLGKVLSRSVREFLNEQELLFPAPPMKLTSREREILTLAAGGKTSKEIADAVGIAKITVDMHVGTILSKMGALNRNEAIAKAISNKLIRVMDSGHAEYRSAKINAVRGVPKIKSIK